MCCVVFDSCTKEKDAPEQSKPSTTPPTTQAATPPPSAKTVVAHMKVVDMEGNPVANMLPIATKRPNAFDTPIAKGGMTGVNGLGTLTLPSDLWLFVRAWDPAKKLFANNYYDVLPGEAPPAEELKIVMLPGSSLETEVVGADGSAVGNQFVGLMMSHPTRGPWWPAETETDAVGRARFDSLPPGQYTLTIETRDGRQVDVPATMFLPGKPTRLGPVILR